MVRARRRKGEVLFSLPPRCLASRKFMFGSEPVKASPFSSEGLPPTSLRKKNWLVSMRKGKRDDFLERSARRPGGMTRIAL